MNRVTTIEQSKKLKELGISQDLQKYDFAYTEDGICIVNYNNGQYTQFKPFNNIPETTIRNNGICDGGYDVVKAFDSFQIDKMLPTIIKDGVFELNTDGYTETRDLVYSYIIELYDNCIMTGYFNQFPKNEFLNETKEQFIGVRGIGLTKLDAKTNLLITLLEHNLF